MNTHDNRRPFIIGLKNQRHLRVKGFEGPIVESANYDDGFQLVQQVLRENMRASFYYYWIQKDDKYLFYKEDQIERDPNWTE